MNIGAAFPSKYLKAANIPEDQPVTVRIDRVEQEDVGDKGKKEVKPVLYFIGKDKGMVLNKTNARVLETAYGAETDDWHGKPVTIVSTETEYAGDMVACLRLRIPKAGGQAAPIRPAASAPKPAAPSPISDEPQFEEADVPF